MPCLNEEETLATCINKALSSFKEHRINGEVVVSDNGSADRSVEIANSLGARVVHQEEKGYGNAYQKGISSAYGKFIVIGDSDDSNDFTDIKRFIEPLRSGKDMVMGTRLKGTIEKGAMPWLHRYIGNPILTGVLNLFFKTGISDAHCGMRSFTKEAFQKTNLKTTGMEFASEMVINASLAGLDIAEIPITLHVDGRSGKPHLRSFRDGWRHLRFMLLYSPTWLFLIPGSLLFFPGLLLLIALYFGPLNIAGINFDIHLMFFSAISTIVGFQVINIGLFSKIYSMVNQFPTDRMVVRLTDYFRLETGLFISTIVLILGLIPLIRIVYISVAQNFPPINEIKPALLGLTFVVIGSEGIFFSFYYSILGIGSSEK